MKRSCLLPILLILFYGMPSTANKTFSQQMHRSMGIDNIRQRDPDHAGIPGGRR